MQDRDFSAIGSHLENAAFAVADHSQTLRDLVSVLAANRFDSLDRFFTDDVELVIHGFPEIQGEWRGRSQVVSAIARNFSVITGQKSSLEGIVSQGDAVAILLSETGVLKDSGRAYAARGVLWYSFSGGLIRRIEEFLRVVD